MKRILTLMLLLLVLAMTCVHAEPGEENITLIVKAEALAAELDALAENEAYIKELSLEEDFEADFFKSSNVDGGDEWNDRLIERYKNIIPGLL